MGFISVILWKTLLSAFTYKKGSLIILSFPISLLLENINNGNFLGISVTFIFLLCILMIVDFFTGLSASIHKGGEPSSKKFAYTFYKALMYFAFFWILYEIRKTLSIELAFGDIGMGNEFVYRQGRYFIGFIRTFIFIILILREFVSIGENLEKRFGQKPYIFVIANRLVDLIEKKVMKKIEDSSLCKDKDGNAKNKKDETKR